MSQFRKTLLQLFIFVVAASTLGSYAYFGIFKKNSQATLKKGQALRVLTSPQDGGATSIQFSKLIITANNETTVLERNSSTRTWSITSPVTATADALVVDAIVSQLQTAKFKGVLEENPDLPTLKKYGLDQPRFKVDAFIDSEGAVPHLKLEGGTENTFDGTVYVRRNDEPQVYAAEGGVRFTFAKSTFDLRDKTPFALDEKTIRTIAVKSVNNAYTLERVQDKQWNLTKPTSEPADSATINAMIAALAGERVQSFPTDTPQSRQELGFDKPAMTIAIARASGAPIQLTFARATSETGDAIYALREDESGAVLATLNGSALHFDRNPTDFRDRSLLRFHREAVTTIEFHTPGQSAVIVKKATADASADEWRVVAPVAGKAKVFRITGALWLLSGAKALQFGEEHPKDWNRYGLGSDAKTIILKDEQSKELARLTIGWAVPETPSAYYVRGSRDQVLQSDGSRFGELPFALNDVLDEKN